jgi:drug/metabolite transporter (DMT)-like permease
LRTFWEGLGLGMLATLAEVVGVVVSRGVLASTNIDPAWSALLRLVAAGVLAWLWMALTRQKIGGWLPETNPAQTADDPPAHIRPRLNPRQRLAGLIAAGVFCGTFIGVWLQQLALKITAAGVAQTLFSTNPLFILLILAVVEHKPPSLRALLGILVAIGGVALLFVG